MKCQAWKAARAPSAQPSGALRTFCAILSVAATLTCVADDIRFDLMEIGHIGGKGRIQDQKYHPNDPQVIAILAAGKEAIPLLIEALESERPYDKAPIDFWPKVVEGDVALAILSDLFLDPTWQRSTLPELCWDNLLGRTNESTPASELLHDFVKSNGRAVLANRWRQAWIQHGSRVRWDSIGRYFLVEGRELAPCVPNNSPERLRER
jgi:hypothetical protein